MEIPLGPVIETKPPLPPKLVAPVAVLFAPLDSIDPVDAILTMLLAVSVMFPPLAAVPPEKLLAAAFNFTAALI